MKKLIALGAALIIVAGCGYRDAERSHKLTLSHPVAICHARDNEQLPDPKCTPGAIDPHVTQANIHKTICVSGYTKTVRPPVSVTNALKRAGIEQYGYADTSLHDFEEDHYISLELGGAPSDPENLWPENPPSPNPKDKVENALHKLVCSGKMSLAEAQKRISTNWTTALPSP